VAPRRAPPTPRDGEAPPTRRRSDALVSTDPGGAPSAPRAARPGPPGDPASRVPPTVDAGAPSVRGATDAQRARGRAVVPPGAGPAQPAPRPSAPRNLAEKLRSDWDTIKRESRAAHDEIRGAWRKLRGVFVPE
jgi:hypothetical protein